MPVIPSDIKLYLTGGAGNTDPNLSLGGVTSSTQLTDNTLSNLFGALLRAELAAGSVKYRALDMYNGAAVTAYEILLWIAQETLSTFTTIAIGLDTTTQTVVNELTAPSGVAFTTPITLATGLAIGDVTTLAKQRIWFRRTVTAGAAALADQGQITFDVGSLP